MQSFEASCENECKFIQHVFQCPIFLVLRTCGCGEKFLILTLFLLHKPKSSEPDASLVVAIELSGNVAFSLCCSVLHSGLSASHPDTNQNLNRKKSSVFSWRAAEIIFS